MSFTDRVLHHLRTDGFIGTLRFGKRWALYKIYHHLSDRKFEATEAVPTSRKVQAADLDYDEELRRHSIEYLAAPRLLVQRAIGLVPESLTGFNFVDIGSGLGRPLLVASEHRFKRVIGYELSPSLHAGAVANIQRLPSPKAEQVQSVLGNALETEWPSGSNVFFLFNPFDAEFMRRFLDRVQASASANDTAYLLLLNFKHESLMKDYRFKRVPLGPFESLFWRVASPYRIAIYRYGPPEAKSGLGERLMCAAGAWMACSSEDLPIVAAFGPQLPL